jgi:hypothetical protein
MNLILFQYSRFEPSSYQADHSRISDSMLHKAQQPSMIKTAEEIL